MNRFRRWRRWRHSLSVSLTAAGVILCVVSVFFEPGRAAYDFFMNMGTGCLLGAIFALAYRYTWEAGSDPTDPPEE